MSQLKKKFLGNNEVGAAKIRLENDSYLRARNAANTADVDIMKLNSSNVPEFGIIPQVTGDPSANNDLVRKSWADTQLGAKQDTSEKGSANGYAGLDASGKVPTAQLPDSVVGSVVYQGTWDASTNDPSLSSGSGTQGYYYVVSVAGSTNLDGITDWQIGDWVIYNGTAWEKVDNSDKVSSVNGATGAVVLDTDDVSEGASNKYYSSGLFDTDFSGKDTDDLTEGATNKYYSSSLFDTDFSGKDTDDLTEGATNKYYSSTLFDSDFSGKTTDDLAEGASNLYAKTWNKEKITLDGTDISNQYVDLAQEIDDNSLQIVVGGVVQQETDDYTLSVEGGVTRVTFAGDLATGGNAELVSGDIMYVQYQY